MRLGFYHHIPITPEENKLYIIGHMGRFLNGLAEYCDSLVLFMHESNADQDNIHEYELNSNKISWVNMGPHRTAPYRTIYGNHYRSIIKGHIDQIDALLIRGPSPLLPALVNLDKYLPVSLLIGGDYSSGVDSLSQPVWRRELIRIWANNYTERQLKAAKRCLTFVNSRKLYEEMKQSVMNLIETKTTTLSTEDFYWREDTCLQTPIHLLYTGRMDRAKGLLDILEAVHILLDQNVNIVLDLVGKEDQADPIISEMADQAKQLGFSDRIVFHGYKPVGPELFAFYKKADIYIIASQTSFEGFPRTIWEALAHSLPVVATRVGSIPYYLTSEENAILVQPRSAPDLARAIQRIIEDTLLRRRIIQNGYQLPQSNTLEYRSKELVENIERYIDHRGKLSKVI
jgi:glycosyltransferase involved in cell wall biosynthesis